MNYFKSHRVIAIFVMVVTFIYLFCVTFIDMTAIGVEHSKTIVGFLLGNVFGTLINYYWGGSKIRNTEDTPEGDK